MLRSGPGGVATAPPPPPPPPPSPPTITTTALVDPVLAALTENNAYAGAAVPYSATVAATGGTPGYTWSVLFGALPAGLTLNAATGVISGIPITLAGETANFTVKVTDSLGVVDTQVLSITTEADHGTDFRTWLRLTGDRVVVLPLRRYTAGQCSNAAHAATAGRTKGNLVLVAYQPHQAIVDQSPPGTSLAGGLTAQGDLIIDGTSTRIVIGGVKFENGSLQITANNVRLWWPEISFSATAWMAEPGFGARTNYHWGNNGTPPGNRGVYIGAGGVGDHIEIYGGLLHDVGTAIYLGYGAGNTTVEGTEVYDLYVGGDVDAGVFDVIHPDCFADVNGLNNGINLTDCHFHPGTRGGTTHSRTSGIQIQDYNGGKVQNIVLQRVWVHDTATNGMVNDSSNVLHNPSGSFGVFGTATNVHLWNCGQGDPPNAALYSYIQYKDDAQVNYTFGSNPFPTRVLMNTSGGGCDQNVAQVGTDPTTTWKNNNPIGTLLAFFDARTLW